MWVLILFIINSLLILFNIIKKNDFSENFSMIKEAFTEIDDCSYYSHYSFEDNNKNNNIF